MIERIIEFSVRYWWLFLAGALLLTALGIVAVSSLPVDAIPDLSETQIIVYTTWSGHEPDDVERSITLPLSKELQGLEGVRTIRGSSEENFSLIHLIFADQVPLSAAREQVATRLSTSANILPPGVIPHLAPDAPATGQIYWYTVEGEQSDLPQLRAIQDGLIRERLSMIPGVAEVASVGGFRSEVSLQLDPFKLSSKGLNAQRVLLALRELDPLPSDPEELAKVILSVGPDGHVELGDVADIRHVVAPRHGMFEKDGTEVVGGVVLLSHGSNPLAVVRAIREAIDQLGAELPEGVRIVTAYDRSPLIRGVTSTVGTALFEAMLTAGICVILVTRHWRASLVIVLTLPLAVLFAFVILWLFRAVGWLDVPINMMSLAGITISIGVLVDSSIVMAENVMHRLYDRFGEQPVRGDVSDLVIAACQSVGRPIFFSVIIMLLSFLPVFALEGLEGKMFRPLAITKSLALAGAAVLAVTLVPALCVVLIRGRMVAEQRSWFVRSLIDVYRPMLQFSLQHPLPLFFVLAVTLLAGTAPLGNRGVYLAVCGIAATAVWISALANWSRWFGFFATVIAALLLEGTMAPIEREFLTPLDEGTAMDMPITIPGIAPSQAIDDLKARNMVLCRYPEVEMVMGKVGRADTATDPAPLDMIETMISFRPREFWPRRRMFDSDATEPVAWIKNEILRRELVSFPGGVANPASDEILKLFHSALREYAFHRNQECIQEAAQRCLQTLVQEVSGSTDQPKVAAAASRLPPPLLARFSDDWPGDTIPEIIRVIGATTGDADAKLGTNPEWTSAKSIARIRSVVLAERRRVWKSHVRRLDSELRQRSGSTLAFLALQRFLVGAEIRDPRLRDEIARLRTFQQSPVRKSRRSHHGIVEPAPPDVDPTPVFDSLVADFARRLDSSILLRASTRQEIAGFAGEMDAAVQMPGWTNVWTMPIQNRVDMLATGVNTTVGVRILGDHLDTVVEASERVAEVVRQVPGATGVVADPIRGRRKLSVALDPDKIKNLGLAIEDVQATVDVALDGVLIPSVKGEMVRVQMSPGVSASPDRLIRLPLTTQSRATPQLISLGDVARVNYEDRPASLKSENGRARNYVRLNVRDRDDADFVREAQQAVADRVALPPGVTLEWTGEFEQRIRAQSRLRLMLPAVLGVIFVVLWFTYRDLADALLMLLAVPGALAGGVLMQWFLGYKFSVTVAVGYVACLGMATSTGIIMLVYLRESLANAGGLANLSLEELRKTVLNGAVLRLRPKLLTEATTIVGLAPMLWATGIGAEVIRPMAAPVLGGILVADEVIDLLLPVLFFWVRRRRWERLHESGVPDPSIAVLHAQKENQNESVLSSM